MLMSNARVASLLFVLIATDTLAAELESDPLDLPIPQVLTPVRLKQPRTEVPASVTVIDRDLIAATGLRDLPEILRLVPGMAVGERSGWDSVVSYHGTNRRNGRRMQVLIDGRSVYQAGLATIEWSDIPVAIEDIERIEVTRGPDTAAYGANAFLGIINIITKHPDDSARLRLKTT
ncbi:MAG TPA: TonB-dependent receptor plug domain-containing protein, partial [Spongiibacteraceae bacterium]|nr:TonB-dependent receptor plug domain-containing protein [Spongiibacteraceae bacterium]